MKLSFLAQPTLFSLYFKTFYFLIFSMMVGWSILPRYLFVRSRLASWLAWISVGASALLLLGFTLVRLNVPGKYSIYIGGGFFLARALYCNLKKIPWIRNIILSGQSLRFDVLVFSLVSLVIVSVYFTPFIYYKTSGFYAYGGGDQSSYFRFSEMMVDGTIASEIKDWGVSGHPPQSFWESAPFLNPQAPNWSANFLVYSIEYLGLYTFANQTIAVPYLSLGGEYTEESYTSMIALYLLIVCWSAEYLGSLLWKNRESHSLALGFAAVLVGLSSAPLSLCLKHAIPALVSWGFVMVLLAIVYHIVVEALESPPVIAVAVLTTTVVLLYMPALLIVGPLIALGAVFFLRSNFKGAIKFIGLAALTTLILGNTGFYRSLGLFIANSTGSLLDYGLNWKMNFMAFVGLCDFETLISEKEIIKDYSFVFAILTVIAVGVGFILMKRIGRYLAVLFFAIFFCAIAHYMSKVGHYHVIRLVEFSSTVFVATFAWLLVRLFEGLGKTNRLIWPAVAVVPLGFYFAGLSPARSYVFSEVTSRHSRPRSSFKGADSLLMARALEERVEGIAEDKQPYVYWMNWGPIQFANNEVLFRNLRYLEGFDYDYSYRYFDVLDPKVAEGSFLVFPQPGPKSILAIESELKTPPFLVMPGFEIFKMDFGKGAALIGTGWVPSVAVGPNAGWTLRQNSNAGLFIWNHDEKPPTVEIELEYFTTQDDPRFLSVRLGVTRKDDIESLIKFEEGAKAKHLTPRYFDVEELLFKLLPRPNKEKLTFTYDLSKGLNILRLFMRDKYGERGGRMPFKRDVDQEVFYRGTDKIPMIVVTNVTIKKVARPQVQGRSEKVKLSSSQAVSRDQFQDKQ